MKSGKLITVSFRLPYRFIISRSRLVTSPSVGGLATALRSYFEASASQEFDSLEWVGISDISKKAFDKVSSEQIIDTDGVRMHPVFITSQMKERFCDGFCNSVIWPLFLYFPSFAVYKNEYFTEYIRANELMCSRVMEVYEPGDTIWIHDYHWMMLPAMLRDRLPEAKIGFFLHISFPNFELYRLLPKVWRLQLILGLMGADVIGFQTDDFAQHFIDSIAKALPAVTGNDGTYVINNRPTIVKSFSISIDYDKFELTSKLPEVRRSVKKIRERIGAAKIMLSVDRLDYTKAIFNRLEGFEIFLRQNPEFREKITYVLLMVPTRESILKYKENKQNVEAQISRINGTYGSIGWTPVVYQYQSVEFKKLVALYGSADIALIVPARDGMNLVAKEYIASRANSDGVLILSETAGAASELEDAMQVNANDRQEISDAILRAVLMTPVEQKSRMQKMKDHVRVNNVLVWATGFLDCVNKVISNIEFEV